MYRYVLPYFKQLAICLSLTAIALPAIAVESSVAIDSIPADTVPHKKNIINRVLDYLDSSDKRKLTRRPYFSILGGPHYSSDTKFGLALMADGVYTTDPDDQTLFQSDFSVYCDMTTAGYFQLGIGGAHIFPHDRQRIIYDFYLSSFSTYFWGIGYSQDSNNDNKTPYRDFRVNASIDWLWRIGSNFFVGPALRMSYVKASHIKENLGLWNGEDLITRSYGIGITASYDTRDHLITPYHGWYITIDQRFYPRFLYNGGYNFTSTEIGINNYSTVWKGGVIASRLHLNQTSGHTPWGMLPFFGGSYVMRGYYEGRYRDKIACDVTVELRQRVWGRSGIVVWGGAGNIMNRYSDFNWRKILPNAGVGYRFEYKKRTNVRLDVGFGRDDWGVVFNINESF